MKIGHIVNPFTPAPGSRMAFAQQVTFRTMQTAAAFAAQEDQITLYTAQYPEDRGVIPEGFVPLADLDRSILDVGSFESGRRLPLIKDILDRLYHHSDADFFVYTNMDIALMPFFYASLAHFIRSGLEAFVINRRTISDTYESLEQIPEMYSEVGVQHEGFDCFVFRREDYPNFELGDVAIGAIGVGRMLLWNLKLQARAFHLFETNHLTFHLGNDIAWEDRVHDPFNLHNSKEVRKFYRSQMTGHRPGDPANPLHPFETDLELFGIRPPLSHRLRHWRTAFVSRLISRLERYRE